jgi:two-component system response regulator AtoC
VTRILIAEDEPEVKNYLGLALNCQGYEVELVENGQEAVDYLERHGGDISLLLLDLMMPIKDGFETLKEVRSGWPAMPVITLSGSCTRANVASVLKGGAVDFLSKPIAHDELFRAIQSALSGASALPGAGAAENGRGVDQSSIGAWSDRVESLLRRIGSSDVPVLLRGETGVGKEVFARKLHEQSRRVGRPFVKVNCAALPSDLVESELFGYEKGAFTGAFKSTPGKFEMANGGTILLDEIGDMDFKLQAKLLQVLQDREFFKLGAKETFRVDVRVMAATHCDLEKTIRDGRFREDLYYRLNIVEVHVPPLRERKDEIADLAEFFLQKYSPANPPELSPRLRQVLLEHDWPGNIRELENVMRKFLVYKSVQIVANELQREKVKRAPVLAGSARALKTEGSEMKAAIAQLGTFARDNLFESTLDRRDPVTAALNSETRREAEESSDGKNRCPLPSEDNRNSRPDPPLQHGFLLANADQARTKAQTEAILGALNSALWNRKQAAKLLKVDYKALLYKMKKLRIGERLGDDSATFSAAEVQDNVDARLALDRD